jgi:hypothetical protein
MHTHTHTHTHTLSLLPLLEAEEVDWELFRDLRYDSISLFNLISPETLLNLLTLVTLRSKEYVKPEKQFT